ncbi:TPA: hypothetical protein HA361_04285 [Candidatus Woesearchaeota archaeon]|nr:hypothetical protein [Candidatus Woesearchaeota archaeon]HII69005.1 hypothetical protein [Candidatus Woesearchaeota archaeon]
MGKLRHNISDEQKRGKSYATHNYKQKIVFYKMPDVVHYSLGCLMLKRIELVIALLALLFAAGCGEKEVDPAVVDFAQCLYDSGMVMYGAYWCPHCKEIKDQFGGAFNLINYVECDPNSKNGRPDLCLEQGIESYPTFILADGERLLGAQSFSAFAAKTGCAAP